MSRVALLVAVTALLLAGCASLGPAAGALARADSGLGTALEAGDLVVAVDRGKGARHSIVRLRPARGFDGGGRVQVQPLLSTSFSLSGVAVSADGRWLAGGEARENGRVRLWDLREGQVDPVWTSPAGCADPAVSPGATFLAMACDPFGRQPAHVLLVDLDDLAVLALVGERDRYRPAWGVDGDLLWVEAAGRRTLVLRRPPGAVPYVTHELLQPVRGLWPQLDGSVLAETALPGTRREFVELLPSGVVRDDHRPDLFPRTISRDIPLIATASGRWQAAACDRGPCGLLGVADGQPSSLPMTLGGHPTAMATVAPYQGPVPHPEDLATAPASVLTSHTAGTVSVLGVELGTPLETAFSTLDRAGRHPYWIEGRTARAKPRGIGLGFTAGGHCIEYLADDRGLVVAVDLLGCASHYLSPPLQPLLDPDVLAGDGGLDLAREFLGPGVAVKVGGGDAEPTGAPIRRTDVVYTAPERGYHFEAHSEGLASGRGRVRGGTVWLRLQLPGRQRAASRAP